MKKKGWNKRVFVAFLVIVMAAACFGCGHETGVGAEKKGRSKNQMASTCMVKYTLMQIS